MNILRKLKILSFNGDSNRMTEHEKFFFGFFDNIKEIKKKEKIYYFSTIPIKFETTKNDLSEFAYFVFDEDTNFLYVNYLKVWSLMEVEFHLTDVGIQNLIERFFKDYLNMRICVTFSGSYSSLMKIN